MPLWLLAHSRAVSEQEKEAAFAGEAVGLSELLGGEALSASCGLPPGLSGRIRNPATRKLLLLAGGEPSVEVFSRAAQTLQPSACGGPITHQKITLSNRYAVVTENCVGDRDMEINVREHKCAEVGPTLKAQLSASKGWG